MKNLIKYGCYTLLAVVLASCTSQSTSVNETSNNRIKLKDTRTINGYRYTILEVDGKEYLTQNSGGFVEITK